MLSAPIARAPIAAAPTARAPTAMAPTATARKATAFKATPRLIWIFLIEAHDTVGQNKRRPTRFLQVLDTSLILNILLFIHFVVFLQRGGVIIFLFQLLIAAIDRRRPNRP